MEPDWCIDTPIWQQFHCERIWAHHTNSVGPLTSACWVPFATAIYFWNWHFHLQASTQKLPCVWQPMWVFHTLTDQSFAAEMELREFDSDSVPGSLTNILPPVALQLGLKTNKFWLMRVGKEHILPPFVVEHRTCSLEHSDESVAGSFILDWTIHPITRSMKLYRYTGIQKKRILYIYILIVDSYTYRPIQNPKESCSLHMARDTWILGLSLMQILLNRLHLLMLLKKREIACNRGSKNSSQLKKDSRHSITSAQHLQHCMWLWVSQTF